MVTGSDDNRVDRIAGDQITKIAPALGLGESFFGEPESFGIDIAKSCDVDPGDLTELAHQPTGATATRDETDIDFIVCVGGTQGSGSDGGGDPGSQAGDQGLASIEFHIR
ncbi:hypothetical protein GCM10023156_33520 [Novipirellula rosea]|uniref:Uncharacterized protein n=1 Tax=Novipirellula rosea TaxID=1031540 RepID=A0ABP8MW79_9BACT